MTEARPDVEQRDGGYYLAGTRVSLDSIVYAFQRGQSPESIAQSFAPLCLAQVYGAITYYLKNQSAIDEYLHLAALDFEERRQNARREHASLHGKLDAARPESVHN